MNKRPLTVTDQEPDANTGPGRHDLLVLSSASGAYLWFNQEAL
jgi:hypothetical protein